MTASRQTTSGFTLAETLVALLILAMVSAIGTSLLFGATSSSKQLRESEAQARQIDLAQALIRNDIAALSVRGVVPESGFGEAGNLFGQSANQSEPILSFVRSGWIDTAAGEQRSTLQHVSYTVEREQLIRTVTVRPDATRATPRVERVLFEGVQRVELQFVRGGEVSQDWIGDAGQPLSVLPDLIDIEIIFADERVLTLSTLTGGRV